MAAAAETETAEARVEHNVGQSYWDVPDVIADHSSVPHGEAWGFNGQISGPRDGAAMTPEDDHVLGAGVEELATQPCPGCCETGAA